VSVEKLYLWQQSG